MLPVQQTISLNLTYRITQTLVLLVLLLCFHFAGYMGLKIDLNAVLRTGFGLVLKFKQALKMWEGEWVCQSHSPNTSCANRPPTSVGQQRCVRALGVEKSFFFLLFPWWFSVNSIWITMEHWQRWWSEIKLFKNTLYIFYKYISLCLLWS